MPAPVGEGGGVIGGAGGRVGSEAAVGLEAVLEAELPAGVTWGEVVRSAVHRASIARGAVVQR